MHENKHFIDIKLMPVGLLLLSSDKIVFSFRSKLYWIEYGRSGDFEKAKRNRLLPVIIEKINISLLTFVKFNQFKLETN